MSTIVLQKQHEIKDRIIQLEQEFTKKGFFKNFGEIVRNVMKSVDTNTIKKPFDVFLSSDTKITIRDDDKDRICTIYIKEKNEWVNRYTINCPYIKKEENIEKLAYPIRWVGKK